MSKIQRLQTAEHILCRLLEDEFGLKPGICKFTEEKGILEVYTEEDMRKIDLAKYEDEVEEIIKKDLPIKKYVLSREDAGKVVDLWKIPKDIDRVRIVEIVDFDKRPCRDEHADRTGEIGGLKILKVERAGKGRYRLTFTVSDKKFKKEEKEKSAKEKEEKVPVFAQPSKSVELFKEAIPISDIIEKKMDGKKVQVRGWAYRVRKQKDLDFIILRDSSGIIQIACKGIPESEKVTIESSLQIEGIAKQDRRAPSGFEIQAEKLEIIGLAERFPIARDLSEEFLRDMRHLWIRSRKLMLTLKVRSEVFRAIHDFYHKHGFTEYQSPILTAQACEGGSTLFDVKGFDKKMHLSQSWQLHAEAGIFALEKIYTVAPMFRAEKSRTVRHLAECWLAEAEAAWMDFEGLIEHEEDLILHIAKHVLEHCKKELKELGRDTSDLEKLEKPFQRLTYKEAIEKLGKKWGHDITDKEERKLVEMLGCRPVFLTRFPRDMKAFYMKVDQKDPKVVLAADLLIPGVGEVTGGSERISDDKELLESLKMFKLKKEDYGWYMDLRKFGSVPHSGFGLGIERIIMWLTGAEHIMDTIPFPRTMYRVEP